MASPFPRGWIAPALLCVFAVSSVFLFTKSSSLEKQNRRLTGESTRLQQLIEQLRQSALSVERPLTEQVALAAIETENSALETEMERVRAEMNEAREEKVYLEEMLINKVRELESLSGAAAAPAAAPALKAETKDLQEKLRERDDQVQKLTERNTALLGRIHRLYKLADQKIAEINVAKMTLDETVSSARKVLEDEWNTVDLGQISASGIPVAGPSEKSPEARGPKLQGRVLAVNHDHGFVVVDIGTVDGVTPETEFLLQRKGQTVGTLKVLEARDLMTACNIRDAAAGVKVAVNDPVLIRK